MKSKHSVLASEVYHDICTIQLYTLDVESFNVVFPLFEKKWDAKVKDAGGVVGQTLGDFLSYFKKTWVLDRSVYGWFQGYNPLNPTSNNSLER